MAHQLERIMDFLEGLALHRFMRTEDRFAFQETIGKIFGGYSDNIMHQFLNISHEGSVKDYHDEFERISVNLPSISNEIMEQIFLIRSKLEFQAELCTNQLGDREPLWILL